MRFARNSRTVGFCLVVAFGLATISGGSGPPPDLDAQRLTHARIFTLGTRIWEHGLEHDSGTSPSIRALKERFDLSDEMFEDGWGNELYFFRSDSQYVLVSFGRDGKPDRGQVSNPGGPTPERNYDADIVWISGEWAQTPWGM